MVLIGWRLRGGDLWICEDLLGDGADGCVDLVLAEMGMFFCL